MAIVLSWRPLEDRDVRMRVSSGTLKWWTPPARPSCQGIPRTMSYTVGHADHWIVVTPGNVFTRKFYVRFEATQIRAGCHPKLARRRMHCRVLCRVQRRQCLVISHCRESGAGYKYWTHEQGRESGRDQFDVNACSLAEISSTRMPSACRRSCGPLR